VESVGRGVCTASNVEMGKGGKSLAVVVDGVVVWLLCGGRYVCYGGAGTVTAAAAVRVSQRSNE
jgi:hypothetical protein